jgi:putative transposase
MTSAGAWERDQALHCLQLMADSTVLPLGDHFQYVEEMEHYRRTSHTRFDLKYHFVWITKYRKKLLQADVGVRLRQIVRDICSELEVEIVKGHVSKDHVHLFVSCPPHVSPSYLMQRVKGKSSRKLLQEFSHLNKQCWGRHLWARGFFVASSGVITDEAIIEYIRTQDVTNADGDFRVEGE